MTIRRQQPVDFFASLLLKIMLRFISALFASFRTLPECSRSLSVYFKSAILPAPFPVCYLCFLETTNIHLSRQNQDSLLQRRSFRPSTLSWIPEAFARLPAPPKGVEEEARSCVSVTLKKSNKRQKNTYINFGKTCSNVYIKQKKRNDTTKRSKVCDRIDIN